MNRAPVCGKTRRMRSGRYSSPGWRGVIPGRSTADVRGSALGKTWCRFVAEPPWNCEFVREREVSQSCSFAHKHSCAGLFAQNPCLQGKPGSCHDVKHTVRNGCRGLIAARPRIEQVSCDRNYGNGG